MEDCHDAPAVNRNAGAAATICRGRAEHRDEHSVAVAASGRSNSGFKLGQFQKVPPIEWQVFDLLASDHAAHLMLVKAEQRSCVTHRDLFAHFADLKREFDSSGRPGLDGGGPFQQTESCCFRRHLVNAWGQRRRAVVAFVGGGEIPCQPAVAIDNANSCAHHRRAGGIRDYAGDSAGRRLSHGPSRLPPTARGKALLESCSSLWSFTKKQRGRAGTKSSYAKSMASKMKSDELQFVVRPR